MSDRFVRVNEDGTRTPIVFFNTWSRQGDALRRLGPELGPDQPVIGVDHPPLDGPMPKDLAAWVAHHRRGFDALDLDPPYRLAGFSFGGVVALEIAQQLRDEGRDVEWLGLVDTLRPKLNPRGAGAYLGYHLGELVDQPDPAVRKAHVRRMVKGGTKRTLVKARRQVLRPLRRVGLRPPPPRAGIERTGLDALKDAVWRGYLSHVPSYYDGPVALFTGDENRAKAAGDPSLRWARYLRGGLEVIPVPGDHDQIMDHPHVTVVAAEITASIERAVARRSRR